MKTTSITAGMRFGKGVDSTTLAVRAPALVFDSISSQQGGQIITSYLKKIESQESLMESLNISVEASVNYGLLDADAKVEFSKEHSVNEYSIYLLLNVKVQNPASFMVNPRLSEEALAVYQNNPEEFRQIFGDSYVESIYSGGEFFGLFILHTKDESTRTELNASLNVSYGSLFTGAEINASFQNTIQEFSKTSSMEIRAIMSGGSGIENPKDIQELLKIYTEFNKSVQVKPIDYEAAIQQFRYLPLPPGPSWAEHLVRKDTVDTYGRYIVEGIKLRSKLDYILSNPAQFENPDLSALKAVRDENNKLIPRWARLATECSQSTASNIETACNLSESGPVFPEAWPKRLKTAGDPLDVKWEEIKKFDTRASGFFKDEHHPSRWDPNHKYQTYKDGCYWIFRSEKGPTGGIFWHPAFGACVVYGTIFREYYKQGCCEGPLGYPKADEATYEGPNKDGLDRISLFEGGSLLWDAQTGKVSSEKPIDLTLVKHALKINKPITLDLSSLKKEVD